MIPSIRLAVVLTCAIALVGCRPLSRHPLVVKAADEVRRNPRVTEALGEPVTCDQNIRGKPNEKSGFADLKFDVQGPKAAGVAVVSGKKQNGEWILSGLEIQFADGGEPVRLTADIASDVPKHDPSATAAEPAAPAVPPEDVEITLPPGVPGG